jgi:hypothetical protein
MWFGISFSGHNFFRFTVADIISTVRDIWTVIVHTWLSLTLSWLEPAACVLSPSCLPHAQKSIAIPVNMFVHKSLTRVIDICAGCRWLKMFWVSSPAAQNSH